MTVKSLRKQLAAAIAMTLVATVALGSSTYAWFVSNTQVSASQVSVTASTTYALQISATDKAGDERNWSTACLLQSGTANGRTAYVKGNSTVYTETVNNATKIYDTPYATTASTTVTSITDYTKAAGATLVPVSTIGKGTANMSFFAANQWQVDSTDTTGNTGNHVATFKEPGANDYYQTSFKIKASQACDLRLDSSSTSFVGGAELKETLRFAFVITGGTGTTPKVLMYQVDDANATTRYNTTLNKVSTQYVDGIKYATKATDAVDAISADNLVSSAVPVYTACTTTPADANSLAAVAASAAEANQILWKFTAPNEECTVTMYIWMEGCDYDCNADLINLFNSQTVIAKVGFCAANVYSSGN